MTSLRFALVGLMTLCGLIGCVSSGSIPAATADSSPSAKLDSSVAATSARRGPIFGQLLGNDGAPAPDVIVRAFLAGTSSLTGNSPLSGDSALVGNAGGALNQQGSQLLTIAAVRLAAGIEDRTDERGRFVLRPDRPGDYNLVAEGSETLKAWKSGIRYAGADTEAGHLQLAPVGHISGRIRAGETTTELSKVTVYVPGSSFNAITDDKGDYTISNVPAGAFDLAAFHVDLGDAKLAETDAPDPVVVESGRTTTAPILRLKFFPPEIASITRPGTLETADNAAPGQTIELHGKFFGLNRGAKAQVQFTRSTPIVPERLSDVLASVVVPSDAATGKVVMTVSGRPSQAQNFRIMKRFDLSTGARSISRGATADLSALVAAFDTDDIRIAQTVINGQRQGSRPFIEWSVDNGRALVAGDVVAALSEGSATLVAKAGALPPRSLSLTVTPPDPGTEPSNGSTPGPTPAGTPPGMGRLAADDSGSAAAIHDYEVTAHGAVSTFVWIPTFVAYQLIDPVAAGHPTRPAGAWVKEAPAVGGRDVDWSEEVFGGFYAAKYEASRADAAPGEPGEAGRNALAGQSATTLKSARYCVPLTNIDWYQAKSLSASFLPPYSHLIRDDEWTALAVWASIHGIPVFGNNAQIEDAVAYLRPSDSESPDVLFLDDPTFGRSASGIDRALTGSGSSPSWGAGVNLTTHTGDTRGVHDLNGNVWEWTLNLTTDPDTGNYQIDGVDTGRKVVVEGQSGISSLATARALRRYGVPGAASGETPYFGRDHLVKARVGAGSLRGGAWYYGVFAGIWALALDTSRSAAFPHVGFRPCLTFD